MNQAGAPRLGSGEDPEGDKLVDLACLMNIGLTPFLTTLDAYIIITFKKPILTC